MPADNAQSRKRVLAYSTAMDGQQLDALRKAILAIEGVSSLQLDNKELRVEYVFPECSYMDIWLEIQGSALAKDLSLPAELREWFRANAEETEQHRLSKSSDCLSYSRDIYVQQYHREQQQGMDSRKHLWRRHQRKK